MNTPPPPPLRHLRSPYDSPYEIRTPSTPRSFEHLSGFGTSSHLSDVPRSSRPKLETRQPAFVQDYSFFEPPTTPKPSGITAAMVSTINKDYLYFVFTRADNTKWDAEPTIEEIPAAQLDIKRKSESQSKNGPAIQQLQRMGPNRRNQIDRFVKTLTNMETDGSLWEVVWLKNTKEQPKGKAMEVLAFQMIIARSQPMASNRNSTGPIPVPPIALDEEPIRFEFPEEKAKKEKRKSKDRKAEAPMESTSYFDDPFAHILRSGTPEVTKSKYAHTGAGYTELPPKKSSTSLKANIIDGLDPDREDLFAKVHTTKPSSGRASPFKAPEDILRNLPKISVDTGRKDDSKPSRRHSTHSRQNSDVRPRSVRFSSQFGLGISSNSSNASGDLGVISDDLEEVETLSSLTSENSSEGRLSHKRHGSRSYELSGAAPSSGRTRRQSSRAAEQVGSQKSYGVEQPRPLSRSNTSKSTPSKEVPPPALYPDEIDPPKTEEEQAHDVAHYIRNSIKESQDKARKDAQKHRPSMSMREQLENLRLDREFGQTRNTVYNHEPRDRVR